MVDRREFLAWLSGWAFALQTGRLPTAAAGMHDMSAHRENGSAPRRGMRLFLCGDVMTGRGIDQILPQAVVPHIYEPYLRDARDYVALAEQASGFIERPVSYAYVWGDALETLRRIAPDLRIINLETAVTTHEAYWPKGINYRMHPANIEVLKAVGIDCCALANNHVLDWGAPGLLETLATLESAGIRAAGAGHNLAEAQAPAALPVPGRGRVLLFSFAEPYSGVARDWRATSSRPGIHLLEDLSDATVDKIAALVDAAKQPGDIAIASIHWGGNWGYEIPTGHRKFAHALVERAGVDLIHGHSSHHFKGIEVFRERLILYGCGDFLNDYEGIRGHEAYRPELGLMYFPELDPTDGRLLDLVLVPTRIRRLRIQRADPEETRWVASVLDRDGEPLGTRVAPGGAGDLHLAWDSAG